MARKQEIKKTQGNQVYRYILEPYRSSRSRVDCPNCRSKGCYARFIDVETGDYLDNNFGRCDRVEKCGYFNSPYGKDIKDKSMMVPEKNVKQEFQKDLDAAISLISNATFVESLTLKDNFSKFILQHFENAHFNLLKYKIGESDRWEGSTVFWQIDQDLDVRTGKIILYDDNCKRVKEPYKKVSWAHVANKKSIDVIPDYNLKQCMFGEHLISDEVSRYNIVESEKTAVICDIHTPSSKGIWLAVGGIEMISEERLQVLEGKKITFYPDKGQKAYDKWYNKLSPFMKDWDIKINKSLDSTDLEDGEDLADLILREKL